MTETKEMTMKTKQELLDFVNKKVRNYGQNIVDRGENNEASALGELQFYISLRNALEKGHEMSEFVERGLLDAILDTFKFMGIVSKDKKDFLSLIS